jgi:hypothetical protein
MNHNITEPRLLETPQQELGELVVGNVDRELLQYVLDRSCTLHCVEAALELHGKHLSTFEHLDRYVNFLIENGPHPQEGSSNGEIYNVDDGWYSTAVANLLRLNGYQVVLQQLGYSPSESRIDLAIDSGRVKSDAEVQMLDHLKQYGGERGPSWLGAISDTLETGGYVVTSILIPSSKVPGAVGRHSVVCTGLSETGVSYFDPDKLLLQRYGEDSSTQQIVRSDESQLIYTQPAGIFLSRMTGELMHIYPEDAQSAYGNGTELSQDQTE